MHQPVQGAGWRFMELPLKNEWVDHAWRQMELAVCSPLLDRLDSCESLIQNHLSWEVKLHLDQA